MKNKQFLFMRLSIIILSILLYTSCNKSTREDSIENALTKMIQKFPQLPKSKSKQTDIYKPLRTIIIETSKIRIGLYTTNDSFPNCNEVIVITNKAGKSMAIPFPANYYRSYWNFQLDELSGGNTEFHTTFNTEFHNLVDSLGLNDSLGSSGSVLYEIFVSLFHCEHVRLSDSNEIRTCYLFSEEGDVLSENRDSSQIRLNRTWDTISKIIHPSSSFYDDSRIFIDYENHRIYEVRWMNKIYRNVFSIEMRTYRLGSIVPPPIMM